MRYGQVCYWKSKKVDLSWFFIIFNATCYSIQFPSISWLSSSPRWPSSWRTSCSWNWTLTRLTTLPFSSTSRRCQQSYSSRTERRWKPLSEWNCGDYRDNLSHYSGWRTHGSQPGQVQGCPEQAQVNSGATNFSILRLLFSVIRMLPSLWSDKIRKVLLWKWYRAPSRNSIGLRNSIKKMMN